MTVSLVAAALAMALQASIAMDTVARGSDSGVEDARQVVVRSMDEWRALWQQHSARPLPDVDFSTSMVVGIFLGSRPTAGYRVDLVGARRDGDRIVVEYTERSPGPGAITAQIVTAPYHLVRLPAAGAAAVEFSLVQRRP